MTKDVSFSGKPPSQHSSRADKAFEALQPKPEPLKRLTIEIPLSLHSRVKIGSVKEQVSIASVVREFLEKRFPADPIK